MRKCKKLLIALFSLCLCISIVGVGVQVNQVALATTDNLLEMHGASVRTVEPDGLRFLSSIPKEFKDSGSFGTLVIPKAILGDDTLNHNLDDVDNVQVDYVDIEQTLWATQAVKELPNFDFDENREYFNAVLVNIPNTDYGTEIVACAYALIDGEYYYAEPITRSIAYVASVGLSNGEESDKLVQFVDGVTDENSLVLNATELTIGEGKTANLGVTVSPNYLIPAYASDNDEVATVENGVVTAVKVGTANITVSLGSIVKTVVVTVEEPIVGDAEDTKALVHLHAAGSNMWSGCNTTGEIVEYASLDDISKPDGVEGESLIKYTFTSAGNWVNSLPLRFVNGAEKAFDEEESTLDFTKAHISFYVYNPNGVDFTAYLAKSANGYFHTTNKVDSVAVKKGEWTKVDFSLTALNIDATGSYDVAIFMAASITAGAGATYYIDNVTIYEAFIPDAEDTKALVHLHAAGSNMWSGCNTTGEIVEYASLDDISKPNGVEGESLIKYTFTSAGNWVNSLPLRFANGAEKAFDEEESTLDFTKAHISFYVYNPNGVDFTAYLAKSANGYFHTTNKVDSVAVKKGEWTKVDFSLAALNISATGSYDVAIFMAASITAGAGATYYIDNVTIYEKHPEAPTDPTTLSYAEWAIANKGSYDFNSTNIPVDANGVSWLIVDNKDTEMAKGKTTLRVTVSFTELLTIPAYCYNASYQFSLGYRHGGITVFLDNRYSSGTMIGSSDGVNAMPKATSLKVYLEELCVINHPDPNKSTLYTWSYYSTVGNYSSGNGRLSTGVDYVFEYDLTKCTGDLELNFGASSIIKGIEWA